jgi:hypothetical protein
VLGHSAHYFGTRRINQAGQLLQVFGNMPSIG